MHPEAAARKQLGRFPKLKAPEDSQSYKSSAYSVARRQAGVTENSQGQTMKTIKDCRTTEKARGNTEWRLQKLRGYEEPRLWKVTD